MFLFHNPEAMSRKRWVFLFGALLNIGGAASWHQFRHRPKRRKASVKAAIPLPTLPPPRLDAPDIVLVTRSLSELPRDLLRQPLLKTILTPDFPSEFASREGLLGLKGALKRLAF